MARDSRQEILDAFERYKRARDEASRTGDWSVWADCFTEDAVYVEHAYGELHGREAIREWITRVMAPFPRMTFPQDWWVLDEERDAIVFQCQNQFPEPFDEDGRPFQFPTWSRLVYGGGGRWKSEEDVYNPARDAPRVFQAWIRAGGKVESPEQVKMAHRQGPTRRSGGARSSEPPGGHRGDPLGGRSCGHRPALRRRLRRSGASTGESRRPPRRERRRLRHGWPPRDMRARGVPCARRRSCAAPGSCRSGP